MDPLDQLGAALGEGFAARIVYVDGLRALHVYATVSELATDVVAVDGHFAVAYEPGADLEAIAPVGEIGVAARRVTGMLAPAVTP